MRVAILCCMCLKFFSQKRCNPFPNKPYFLRVCNASLLKNTVGKGEIACNKQFLLFQVFSTRLDNCLPFSSNLKLSSADSFSLEEVYIFRNKKNITNSNMTHEFGSTNTVKLKPGKIKSFFLE